MMATSGCTKPRQVREFADMVHAHFEHTEFRVHRHA